ncbi:hypothetical protein C4375_00180 [Devosia sp. I507]|nr:hypothetical protein C4375_00180 [Devosia sp. I507]
MPLAGCGLLGSATALDKIIAKRLLNAACIPVARSVAITKEEAPDFAALERALGSPMFIKPARQGSSVGVRKVSGSEEFPLALEDALRFDRDLLVEEFVAGREIEFSVLEDETGGLFISRPGEIVPAEQHGFYSYDAKYVDETGAVLKVPADLPLEVENAMRDMAARAFRALGCDGMARVDFFLKQNGDFLVNELNTIPGFTDISMYAKAMAASGTRATSAKPCTEPSSPKRPCRTGNSMSILSVPTTSPPAPSMVRRPRPPGTKASSAPLSGVARTPFS